MRNFFYLKKIISWVEVNKNLHPRDREYIWLVWRAGVFLLRICAATSYTS